MIEYGSPKRIAEDKELSVIKMRSWGKSQLKDEKINRVIEGACHTLGQPCTEVEMQYLQALATEMKHSRLQQQRAKKAIELMIKSDDGLQEMGQLIGLVTTALLLSCHLDPRNYDCASSYLKAFGLNLKEKSSGKHIGQLKLTKRGSATLPLCGRVLCGIGIVKIVKIRY